MATLVAGSLVQSVMASDDWKNYFANIGGHPASILFDDGISSTLSDSTLKSALRLKIEFTDTNDAGLPTPDSAEKLNALEDALVALMDREGALYLGRVTSNGSRWIMALTRDDASDLRQRMVTTATDAGFATKALHGADPRHEIYWEDLYPTSDDRRVMEDMGVLNALAEAGDNPDKIRAVEHWAYFSSSRKAQDFSEWLSGQPDYEIIATDTGVSDDGQAFWSITFKHDGDMLLNSITSHTLLLTRQIEDLGGDYDGWETAVTE